MKKKHLNFLYIHVQNFDLLPWTFAQGYQLSMNNYLLDLREEISRIKLSANISYPTILMKVLCQNTDFFA